MTDEYAAHYLLKQGYLAGRIEALEKRAQIAEDIMTAHNNLECCKLVSPLCSCESAAHIALHGLLTAEDQ